MSFTDVATNYSTWYVDHFVSEYTAIWFVILAIIFFQGTVAGILLPGQVPAESVEVIASTFEFLGVLAIIGFVRGHYAFLAFVFEISYWFGSANRIYNK